MLSSELGPRPDWGFSTSAFTGFSHWHFRLLPTPSLQVLALNSNFLRLSSPGPAVLPPGLWLEVDTGPTRRAGQGLQYRAPWDRKPGCSEHMGLWALCPMCGLHCSFSLCQSGLRDSSCRHGDPMDSVCPWHAEHSALRPPPPRRLCSPGRCVSPQHAGSAWGCLLKAPRRRS